MGKTNSFREQSYGMNQSESIAATIFYCYPTPTPTPTPIHNHIPNSDNCAIAGCCVTSQIYSRGPVANSEYIQTIDEMTPDVFS